MSVSFVRIQCIGGLGADLEAREGGAASGPERSHLPPGYLPREGYVFTVTTRARVTSLNEPGIPAGALPTTRDSPPRMCIEITIGASP